MQSVKSFGAVGDGITDDSAAFTAALASTPDVAIYVPAGNYLLNSSITITNPNTVLFGDSPTLCRLFSNSSGAAIYLQSGVSGINIKNLCFYRQTPGTSPTQNGIECGASLEGVLIDNVITWGHYNGISLQGTNFSYITNVITRDNYNHGLVIQNPVNVASPCQWTLNKILSQTNNGFGYLIASAASSFNTNMSLGDYTLLSTFANNRGGFAAIGLSNLPIEGIRMQHCFFGQDGNDEIYLNTFGFEHRIINCYTELSGTSPTGVQLLTPPTHQGHGIVIDTHDNNVLISSSISNGNSGAGVYFLGGSNHTLSSSTLTNNGQNPALGGNAGLVNSAQSALISSNRMYGNQYGIWSGTDNHLVIGNDLRGNTAAEFGGVTLTSSTVVGNK